MAEGYFRYYYGRQRVGEAMANVLINGSKRYNKKRRKHTKMNNRKRRQFKNQKEKVKR
jgi:hypothetical protein